ncbi:MAG: hypothetical protein WCJ58_02930 [bacterium]
MDNELKTFLRDFQYFHKEWTDFYRNFNEMRRELTELRKEMGVKEGRVMAQQINEMEHKQIHHDEVLGRIERDTVSVRKFLEYNELNVKEIMKALALIYRNVDELEDGLLPEKLT